MKAPKAPHPVQRLALDTPLAVASRPAKGSRAAAAQVGNQSPQTAQLRSYASIANGGAMSHGGLPSQLKTGIASLSGMDLGDVQVHYNSEKPAQLQALAYAQGNSIHLGPGQERHLPHEAWHVVQQRQGRVKPTLQLKGVAINDDSSLEREADQMGDKAMQFAGKPLATNPKLGAQPGTTPIQRKVGFEIEIIGAEIREGGAQNDDGSDDEEEKKIEHLHKGQVLHQGNQWKLTPDNRRGDEKFGYEWTPEYVTTALDETGGSAEIEGQLNEIATHANKDLFSPKKWSAHPNVRVEDIGNDDLRGNFHVTGGVRLSRIGELIKAMFPTERYHKGKDPNDPHFEENLVSAADRISGRMGNYKSMVAYVALCLRDMLSVPKKKERDGLSAKQNLSILSRTDLGVAVAAVSKLARRETFIQDVLTVADAKGDEPLFKNKLADFDENRTIDQQQNLTARAWLEKLTSGHDFVWNSTPNDQNQAFGMEPVGPERFLIGRAEGIILELRALVESELAVPLKEWPQIGRRYATLFQMLNAKKDFQEVTGTFWNKDQYGYLARIDKKQDADEDYQSD